MDKTIDNIKWEGVKNIKFEWHPVHDDMITVTYKTSDVEYLSMGNCFPLAEPPKEEVLIYIPKNLKNTRDLPKEDVDKLKIAYKNGKDVKIYDKGDRKYILKPESDWGKINDGRFEKWKKFKEEVNERWESSKPRLIQDLKKQLSEKQKETDEIQNRILNLM